MISTFGIGLFENVPGDLLFNITTSNVSMPNAGDSRKLVNTVRYVESLLNSAGVPSRIIPYAVAQAIFETGGFKSHVSTKDFNLSGIKFINKSYQNAKKGSADPEGGNYARYDSYLDWAKDFKRVISIGKNNAAIHANDLQDYVNRLHDNHYFTASPSIYYRGVKTAYDVLPQTKESVENRDEAARVGVDHKPGIIDWWGGLSTGLKIGFGAGATLLILAIVRKK